MKFWFCEKCGKRLTDADFDAGRAADKQARGVYCTSCSIGIVTAHIEAISGLPPKSSATAMKSVPKDSNRHLDPASATTPSMPVLPVATGAGSSHSSRMLLIPQKPSADRKPDGLTKPAKIHALPMIAGGAVALIVAAAVMLSSSPTVVPERVGAAPTPDAPRSTVAAPAENTSRNTTFLPQTQTNRVDPEQQINDAFDELRGKFKSMNKDEQAAALEQFIASNAESIAASRARKLLSDLQGSAPPATTTVTPVTPVTPTTPGTQAAPATAGSATAPATDSQAPATVSKPSSSLSRYTRTRSTAVKVSEPGTPETPNPAMGAAANAEAARAVAYTTLVAYAAFQSDFQTALRTHDKEKAKSLLAQAELNETLAAKKTELAAIKPALDWLTELDDALPKGAAKLKDAAEITLPVRGSPIRVGKSAEFKFVDFKDDEILIGNRGMTLKVPLATLPDSTRFQLAAMGLPDDPHGKLLQAFAAYFDRTDRRGDAAVLARLTGVAPAEEVACLKKLFADAEADARERAAADAWKDLTKLGADYDSKRAQLKAGIAGYRTAFGETAFAALHGPDLNDLDSLQWEPDPKGLLIRLKLDELQGAALADASGQNRGGTAVNGPLIAPGKLNGALSFNGSNQYVSLPGDLFQSRLPLSVCVWFNTTAGGVILCQQDTVSPPEIPKHRAPVLYVGTDGKLYTKGIYKGGGASAAGTTVNDGKWHLVVLTTQKEGGAKSKEHQNIYLDGQLVNGVSGDFEVNAMPHTLLGTGYTHYWYGGNTKWYYFKGLIDDFRVYERILTDAEIQRMAKRE